MNRRQRRVKAGWVCQLCQQRRGHRRTLYCLPCVERIRERHRCPDCNSVVTTMIAEDTPGLQERAPARESAFVVVAHGDKP